MTTRRGRWRAPLAAGAVAAFGFVACGGGGPGGEAQPAPSGGAPVTETPGSQNPAPPAHPAGPEVPPESAIPAVDVVDVVSGDEFALESLVPSDRPLLVWFWAPH